MRTLLVSVVVMTCAVAAHAAPKKVLFKQFTATWSGYDPSVSEGLYSVIQANPQTTCAIQIHGGDNYVTPLGNTLINFYDVDGYPTVWLDGMWLQYGSTGSPEENEASLLELLNGASFTTDVTIEVTGETVGENEYALSVTLGIEDGGETRDMKLYITQVYDDVSWPEPGEFQMNTLRQAASPQTVTLAPGESQTYAHTFTLENESLNTNFVNYIVWAQENSDSAPAMIYQTVVHEHGDAPQADVTVGPGYDFETIQEALNAVGSGSTVTVQPGIYNEPIDFIGRDITLVSSSTDPADTIIDAGGTATVVTLLGHESAVIDGFTIRNGRYTYGSAFKINGSPSINNCIIRNNVATEDYVVLSVGGSPVFSSSIFCANTPNTVANDDVVIENCTFEEVCPGSTPCPTDLNDDGTTNVNDVLLMLACWGTSCGDVNDDDTTDVNDVLQLLSEFGNDCE